MKSANNYNHFHIANARPHDDNHLPSINDYSVTVFIQLERYGPSVSLVSFPMAATEICANRADSLDALGVNGIDQNKIIVLRRQNYV